MSAGRETLMVLTSDAVFVNHVFRIAKEHGHPLERTRQDWRQIDFGHKKLHEDHIRQLYPDILQPGASIPRLIESVAPGRPCTHKPMREIIAQLRK
jgi:hypothetical protein